MSATSLVVGNRAYLAAPFDALQVIDISDELHPRLVGKNSIAGVGSLAVYEEKLYAGANPDGVIIYALFQDNSSLVRLEATSRPNAGLFRLSVEGPLGRSVRIQKSTDLKSWSDWQSVILTSPRTEIFDSDALNVKQIYYRGLVP